MHTNSTAQKRTLFLSKCKRHLCSHYILVLLATAIERDVMNEIQTCRTMSNRNRKHPSMRIYSIYSQWPNFSILQNILNSTRVEIISIVIQFRQVIGIQKVTIIKAHAFVRGQNRANDSHQNILDTICRIAKSVLNCSWGHIPYQYLVHFFSFLDTLPYRHIRMLFLMSFRFVGDAWMMA